MESYPEALKSVWASDEKGMIKALRQRRLALLPNDRTGGHYKLKSASKKNCNGQILSLARVSDLYERVEVSRSNACQITFQLKSGRFSKHSEYEEIIRRTGVFLDDIGTWRQPKLSSIVYLEVDAFATCENLTRVLTLAVDGRVLSAIEGPLPPIRAQGPGLEVH